MQLNDPGLILCGGTPSSLPVVTVSLTDFRTAPDVVGSAGEALHLVQPGGTIQFVTGALNHIVRDVYVTKPVLVQSADAGSPVIDREGAQRGFWVRDVASRPVEFLGLTFVDAGYASVDASVRYDQVIVDGSHFPASFVGVFSGSSDVVGSRVTVMNSTFS